MDDPRQWEDITPPDSTGNVVAKFELSCSTFDAAAKIWDRFTDKNVSIVVAGLLLSGLLLYFAIPYGLYHWITRGEWRKTEGAPPVVRTEAASPDTNAEVIKTTPRGNGEAHTESPQNLHTSASNNEAQIGYMLPTWIAIIRGLLFLLFLLLAVAGSSQTLRLLGFHDTSNAYLPFILIYGKFLVGVFRVGFAAGFGFGTRFINTAKKLVPCMIAGNFLPVLFGLITYPSRTLDHLYFDTYQVAVLAAGFPLSIVLFSLLISTTAQLLFFTHGAAFLCGHKLKNTS
jgi:uncharacterized integral membrane protein